MTFTVFILILFLHHCSVSEQLPSRFECGENGKFEYCIDGFAACVIGCHCYPGYYFDTETKICEPNSKLFELSRRYNEVPAVEAPTIAAVFTTTIEPEISTTAAVSEIETTEAVINTTNAENLGDWLYDQFFKTIENSVFNSTDERLQSRRNNGDLSKDNLIRVKKKAKKTSKSHNKHRKMNKKSLLRLTENDSIFDSRDDSSSSDEYTDSSDTSGSSETCSDSDSASKENGRGHSKSRGQHKHKQILIINKKPKVPLPSFLFLPNVGAQYYPQMSAPAPVPMYPMVPVPPVMPPMYSYPACSEENQDNDSTSTTLTQTTTNTAISTVPTKQFSEASEETTVTTVQTTSKPPQTTSKAPKTTVLSSDDSSDKSKEITTTTKETTTESPEVPAPEATTAAGNIEEEVTESDPEKADKRQGRTNNKNLGSSYKQLRKRRLKVPPRNINRIAIPYQPPPIHPIRPQILPEKTDPSYSEETYPGFEESLSEVQFDKSPVEMEGNPPNFKYLSELIHKDYKTNKNAIPPIISSAVQPKTLNINQNKPTYSAVTNMNIPYKLFTRRGHPENISNNNNEINNFYGELGKQIAQLVRKFNPDSDKIIYENRGKDRYQSMYNYDPLHQEFSEKLHSQPSRSYWERSIRSLNKQTQLPLSKTKRSSDNILSYLEDKVNLAAAKSAEMLGLEELENIINIMGMTRIIESNSNNDYTHAKISQSSFDVGLAPVANQKNDISKILQANPNFQEAKIPHPNFQNMNPQPLYSLVPKIQHNNIQINHKNIETPRKSNVRQVQTNLPKHTRNYYSSNKFPVSSAVLTHPKPVFKNIEHFPSFLTSNRDIQREIPIPISNLAKVHFNLTEHNLFIPNLNSNIYNQKNKHDGITLQRNNIISPYYRMPYFNKYYVTTMRPLSTMYSGLVAQVPLLKYLYPFNPINQYEQRTLQRQLTQPVHQRQDLSQTKGSVQSLNLFQAQGRIPNHGQGQVLSQRQGQPSTSSLINSVNRLVNTRVRIGSLNDQPSYFHHDLNHFDFFD